ncbi:MAG TPA: SWIM zinc finger family protein [Ohtaekwangia sp.]|uniref:SWIM zinc finger family protein n=1 Tax=Ohtaekwangia sp. TaxID=2066019 RepID=UPI002F9506ED
MNFSEEQILALAPDESSKKSGKELANASKWVKREVSERALWGECQGSGKLPYQTQIDLVNVAFKCSCPSRKFPCKHGLGLMLLYARDKKIFTAAAEPDWVTGWLDKRTDREEKKAEKKEKEKKADPAEQARRQENRMKRVEDGMADLRLWIKDIVRNGLLNIPGKDASYFENMARRMVDAQASGLAAMVRALRDINVYQDGWQSLFLDQIIRIYLALEGFPRMDILSGDLQDELKTLIGFTQNQDELRSVTGIRDNWFVLSKSTEKEDNLTTERNWLYGSTSQRYALILQFYVRGQLPEVNLLPGSSIDAELVYFRGANPFRALIRQQFGVNNNAIISGLKDWSEAAAFTSAIHTANPWASSLPVIVENVVPVKAAHQWLLKDAGGKGAWITQEAHNLWKLLAVSGGKPLHVFAVGNENTFEPLGAWMDNQYTLLA